MDLKEKLEKLKTARELIREVIINDLRDGIIWLSSTRVSAGDLDVAIQILEKDILKLKEKKFTC